MEGYPKRKFSVFAIIEGFRITEEIMAVSINHAIKVMKSKYNNARNGYVLD